MASYSSIVQSALRKAASSSKKGIVRELAESGAKALEPSALPGTAERAVNPVKGITAAAKSPSPVGVLMPDQPTQGDPSLMGQARTTQQATAEPGDWIKGMKTVLRGFYRHEAGLSPDLRRQLIDTHALDNMTDNMAARALGEVYEPVMGDMKAVALVTDFSIQADEVAQAVSGKKDTIRKWDAIEEKFVESPTTKWIESLAKLREAADADPRVSDVLVKRSEFWADVFDQMVDDGLIVAERERESYTPLRRIHAIGRAIDAANGDESVMEAIGALSKRGRAVAPRESNLAAIEHAVFSRYLRWRNAHRLSEAILSDEYLNRTKDFRPGQPVPKGWTEWVAAPSTPGFVPEGDLVKDAVLQIVGRGTKQSVFTGMGHVIPEQLADALGRYRVKSDKGFVEKSSQAAARLLTVYNPKNTVLNILSDTPTALLGLPGEPAHPLGTIKWLTRGFESSFKDVFQGKGTTVDINGQKVDISDLLSEQAVGGSTFATQVGATRVRPELTGLTEPQKMNWFQNTLDFAKKTRQAVEQAPRIAAGLEALERTGSEAEFGRVARQSTLEYGIATPDWARNPKLKLMAPFLEFAGLATGRVVDLLQAKGSRVRSVAAIVGFPVAIMLWNSQNDEYKRIRDAVSENWKSTTFIIVPGADGQPRRDVNGNPVVIPIRWSVPESVAQTFGMGNLAHRIQRVAEGKDTPFQAVKESVKQLPRSMADFLTIPGLAQDIATGKDKYGRELDMGQRVQRVAPVLKIPARTIEATKDFGLGEGATTFLSELTGHVPMKTATKGGKPRDAALIARVAKVKESKRMIMSAKGSGRPPSELARLTERHKEAVEELKRYVKATKATREQMEEPE